MLYVVFYQLVADGIFRHDFLVILVDWEIEILKKLQVRKLIYKCFSCRVYIIHINYITQESDRCIQGR